MKRIFFVLLLCSSHSIAGTWYEDWDVTTVPVYSTKKVYQGWASCYLFNERGYYIRQWVNVAPILYEDILIYLNETYGVGYGRWEGYTIGNNSCRARVPFSHNASYQSGSVTEYYPIEPYTADFNIERLGCVSTGIRKVHISLSGNNTHLAKTMKIYSGSSPAYPESLQYSGAFSENILLNVNADSNIKNFRIRVDSGSSSYTTVSDMSCAGTGGGGRPLN